MSSEIVRNIAAMRTRLTTERQSGSKIGFVPTMGALHAGHGALMDAARRDCAVVVASVFVNPTQFNNKEDYERYGRNLDADVAFSDRHGVDIVFAPSAEEMYPAGGDVFVEVPEVSEGLCGAFRPGHFRGVATVVTKLFHIVEPDVAYFGEKDAQQLAVIRRLVAGLNMPITIAGIPTVRDSDGLALSSRNERLTHEDRQRAPLLYRALEAARREIDNGVTDVARIRTRGLEALAQEPSIRVEYFEVVDADSMRPAASAGRRFCIAGAIWIGEVRLIDNVLAGG